MSQRTIRIAISVVVVVGSLAGLLSMSLGETAAYYKHVDEVMAAPEQWYDKNLQLHGHVVDGTIMRRPNTLDYRFSVQSNGKVVQATYTGVVPDNFKGGSEVVLRGRLSRDGFAVQPKDGIMAKCPSRYDPASAAIKPGSGTPSSGGGR
jgi:cytochrome c-type biogenesis protein CcmE